MTIGRLIGAFAVALALTSVPVLAQSRGDGPAVTQVNLNTATAAELERLPGVGAATAARIIEYRQKNGGFTKIEDLMNVQGIGEKRFLDLKPRIVVTPARTAQ